MNNFKFRQMYGFSPGPEYQLAFQTAGALPVILASEVPPRFEQYLIVDIIVDPKFKELTKNAIPPGLKVPGENEHSHFIAFDFGICVNEEGGYEPQLIEMQGLRSMRRPEDNN